jgi:protein arginine N-methyltransferase 1
MYIAAIEDADYREEKISFWDNVYGFDMTPIKRLALHEPLVDTVDANVSLVYFLTPGRHEFRV